MEVFFDAAGEFDDHYTGEILDRDATIAGIRAELTQLQEFRVFEWKRKSEKPPNEKVIRTKMFHKAKGDEVRSRIVAREYADGVFASEHHAGTPPTWSLKLVISRMMSKGRARQLASHDVSAAFFHAWLERGVWVKLPKDLRLCDDWLWYVVNALYGMRESSKAFQEVVREMYTTYGETLLQTVPCFAHFGRLESSAGWHGDDFYTEGIPGALDEVDEMILPSFTAKELPRLGPAGSTEGTILRRILRWSHEGVLLAPHVKHVENLAGCETESNTTFPSHWSWAARCVGATDSCRGHRVSAEVRGLPRISDHQVRSAVCDKGTRSRHADAKQRC